MIYQKLFAAFVLSFAFLLAVQTADANYLSSNISQIVFADRFYRTELYFGMNKNDGGTVSGEEWDEFLEGK